MDAKVEKHERLAFVERELKAEIKELRQFAKEDEREIDKSYGEDRARLAARANAYRYAADQMHRILKGRTAAQELTKRLLK